MSFIFDIVLLLALRRSAAALFTLFWVFYSFGALTVLPPEWTGGANLLVGSVAALLFSLRIMLTVETSRIWLTALDFRQLGFLTFYTLMALLSAFVLPKIMSHVEVYPITGGDLSPVSPGSGNVTQSLYVLVSFCMALACAIFMRERQALDYLRHAFIAGASFLVISGFVDIIAGSIGASNALDVFRTASYTFMLDNEVLNVRRTIGFMTEASSFGAACVLWSALLLFTRHMFNKRQLIFVVTPLAVLCALLAVLSTSSGTYVALLVTFILFFCDVVINLWSRRSDIRRFAYKELYGMLFGVLLFLIVILSFPSVYRTIEDMLNAIIFTKNQSSSFAERNAWTEAGLDAFFKSFGIGVGIGSVRTSNLFVNILASTGLLGALMFTGFLCRFYSASCSKAFPQHAALLRGIKLATIPSFAQAALVGTIPDYGAALGALFGIVVGVGAQKRLRDRPQGAAHYCLQRESNSLNL